MDATDDTRPAAPGPRPARHAVALLSTLALCACGDSSDSFEDLPERQSTAIAITEIQASPCRTDPLLGEWFEITNLSSLPIDINGWRIQTESGGVHEIDAGERLLVVQQSHVVLAPSDDGELNGNLRVKYVYSGIELADDVDTIILADAFGEVADVVRYDSSWPNPGCDALQLSAASLDRQANDRAENWCRSAVEREGRDRGSPALPNEECPVELCGDGRLASGEICDDGDLNSAALADACRPDCRPARCGDGVTDTLEECDSGERATQRCDAACLAQRPRRARDLLITEIMRNTGAADDRGQWFELHNLSPHRISLNDCLITDRGPNRHRIRGDRLLIEPSGHLVLARSDDPTDNGGLTPDYIYGDVALASSGGRLALECDELIADEVAYGDETAGWPDDAGFAMNLGRSGVEAGDNQDPALWCSASTRYGDVGRYGTPGDYNRSCWDREVDRCRIEGPAVITTEAGQSVTVRGRYHEAGITDQSERVDYEPVVAVQAGVGPTSTQPKDNPDWSWYAALASPNWLDESEPGADEYDARIPLAVSGTYDVAFRVSIDGGLTWDYCDRAADDDGQDGGDDGYQVANALSVNVLDGKSWGGLAEARLRAPAFELSNGASFERLRALIFGDGGALASAASELSAESLARVKVVFLSRLDRDTTATDDERDALFERVRVGGTLIVAGGLAATPAYDTFTAPFGVTNWRAAAGSTADYVDPDHPITAGVLGLELDQSAAFTVPDGATVLATDVEGAPLIAVLEPTTGSMLSGRVLVVGDYRWFTDEGVEADPALADNVVRWVRSSTEQLRFPLPDDRHELLQGTRPFADGDFIEGVRDSGLAAVSAAEIRFPLVNNWLSCDSQNMALSINGQAVGVFEIVPRRAEVEARFDFEWVAGPSYRLRLEVARGVASGCGSAGFDESQATVTLIGRALDL